MDRQTKKASPHGPGSLAENVARLSRMLTRGREELPAAYLRDPGLRKAYLSYFLPPNLAKVLVPLRDLSLHPADLLARDRLRILDLGSGPGTAVAGIRSFFAPEKRRPYLEFTAVDQVEENLKEAEALFRELDRCGDGRASLTTVKSRLEALAERSGGPFDIILLSNVLNELYPRDGDRIARRTTFVAQVLERFLAPDGACIIIEPALRETSRELLLVRDVMVDAGVRVYSPCLVQGRCPALVNSRDWCHEDRPWEPTELIREINERIGLRKDSLKFSYLVLRKDGRSLSDACGPGAFRVVSEPLISKGKTELYLCGREGRRLAARFDKDASDPNGPFGSLLRGDIIRVEGLLIEEKRFRIAKGTKVVPMHAFGHDRSFALQVP
jgi:ribosomal protein RSM22 (predicted rRNA methylase)